MTYVSEGSCGFWGGVLGIDSFLILQVQTSFVSITGSSLCFCWTSEKKKGGVHEMFGWAAPSQSLNHFGSPLFIEKGPTTNIFSRLRPNPEKKLGAWASIPSQETSATLLVVPSPFFPGILLFRKPSQNLEEAACF